MLCDQMLGASIQLENGRPGICETVRDEPVSIRRVVGNEAILARGGGLRYHD
jgi:hypothetical protein